MPRLTGIDLPFGAAGGSMQLLADLYLAEPEPPIPADVLTLAPHTSDAEIPDRLRVLRVKKVRRADAAYVTALAAAIRSENLRPDIIHAQHLSYGMSPTLQACFPGVPSIAVCHGTDLLAARQNADQRRILQGVVAGADALVFPTGSMVELAQELAGFDIRGKSYVVPWGVDVRKPGLASADSHGPILFVGRSSEEKGLERALSTMEHLRASYPCAVVTDRRPTRLPDGVGFRGWMPRRDLFELVARAVGLLVPSNQLEAFSLIAIEAQALGVPVFHSGVPGLRDTVGDSGIQVDFDSPRRAATVIAATLDDPAARRDLVDRGLRNAAGFSFRAMVEGLLRVEERMA